MVERGLVGSHIRSEEGGLTSVAQYVFDLGFNIIKQHLIGIRISDERYILRPWIGAYHVIDVSERALEGVSLGIGGLPVNALSALFHLRLLGFQEGQDLVKHCFAEEGTDPLNRFVIGGGMLFEHVRLVSAVDHHCGKLFKDARHPGQIAFLVDDFS